MELLLEDHAGFRESITGKMSILPPPQQVLIGSYDENPLDHTLPVFTFSLPATSAAAACCPMSAASAA